MGIECWSKMERSATDAFRQAECEGGGRRAAGGQRLSTCHDTQLPVAMFVPPRKPASSGHGRHGPAALLLDFLYEE
jgi:hypothetical protein